ncbi:MAG: LTA synthase family protein, partial [Bacteroidota bacterium]
PKPMTRSQRSALMAIILLLAIYQLQRLLFLLFNIDYFTGSKSADIFMAFLHGLRFDLCAITLVNLPFILTCLLPIEGVGRFTSFTKWIFYLINIPVILLNTIDIEYFKFQGKRTSADLFELFFLGDDMQNTLPQMAKDFWPVLLFATVCSVMLVVGYNNILKKNGHLNQKNNRRSWAFALLVIPFVFIGARGSIDLKPLRISNAAAAVEPKMAPLVLNTPFTIIKTFGKQGMDIKFEMSEQEAEQYFTRLKTSNRGPIAKNAMIIILESFSAEYSNLLSGNNGYTPFLDSLMKEGLYFTNAYANAKKSMDGIPAVTSSIPSLMPVSFITSPYAANNFTSVAGLLQKGGYSSAFFHGGNNGTMGFDHFTKNAGYEAYYGRNEYGNQNYDGNWGVYDEPFYRFVIDQCNKLSKPFVGTVFSLSSHHPYSIPEHLKNKFPKGTLPIHESIGYADYSLKVFFEEASKTDWYRNTVFVITADHTGPANSPAYGNRHGAFRIPLFYFTPDQSLKGSSKRVTQQTDILPSVMDMVGYKGPWLDFGTSVLDSSKTGFAVNGTGDLYQIIMEGKILQFDGMKTVGVYDLTNDSLLEKNLSHSKNHDWTTMENTLKSVLIQYAKAMNENKITNKLQ